MLAVNVHDFFFDRQSVIDALSATEERGLSKIGAFIMTRARTSIKAARQMSLADMEPEQRAKHERAIEFARKRGKPRPKRPLQPSRPGEPPRSVTKVLKHNIYFAFDPRQKSVVTGPSRLNGRAGKDVPQTLERGGETVITGRSHRGKRARIAARPFMGPAMEKEMAAGTIPEAFRDALVARGVV